MKYLQKIGKSLMLPVAALPICGILMGLGYLLCPASMQGKEVVGFVAKMGFYLVKAGGAVIDNMALLFVIGVSLGMSDDNHGSACLSGLISWLVITTMLSPAVMKTLMPEVMEDSVNALAFGKIQNPFIGILSGLLGAECYNRFKGVKLPDVFAFFSGRRFVAIITMLLSLILALVLGFVWPAMFDFLVKLGQKIVSIKGVGAGIFAFLNRLLIPSGLHHALNNVFWFDTIGIGDLTKFWSGNDGTGLNWSLGMYMSGFFPPIMFGIPGAALAMYRCAKDKKKARGILLSVAACAFICGVTEPFEFLFVFIAFPLYVVYALLYGIITVITYYSGFRAGFAFSAGATDLLFSASMPAAAKTWMIIPLGLLSFVLFYIVFRFMIVKFDFKTPGREEENRTDEPEKTSTPAVSGDGKYAVMAAKILAAVGGSANVRSVDCCATRLRFELADNALLNTAEAKSAGAMGAVRIGKTSAQVIVGLTVQQVCEEVKKQLSGAPVPTVAPVPVEVPPASEIPLMRQTESGNNRKEFKCNVAQKGFFAGPVFHIRTASKNTEGKTSNIENELRKLHAAMDLLENSIRQRSSTSKNDEIQETVLSILEDEVFRAKIEKKIKESSLNASTAVSRAAEELSAALGSVESEYIRSRQDDIRGVAGKLISILEGRNDTPEECSAICAPEISPAQLSSIDDALIGGMLTEKGSPNSHASILAGNIGVPYLYGNSEAVTAAKSAQFIIIDSDQGTVITDPDEESRKAALLRMEQVNQKRKAEEETMTGSAASPTCKTKIYANIEGPQDIDALLDCGADGVGLFRTEFLFLGMDHVPSEQEQYEAYRSVLEAMGGKEVIIRTMDIGSDKKVSWLKLPEESNPALGLRGVRVSLEREELFKTQLRALLRAGVAGNLKVMFPMIASEWEVDEIRHRVQEAAEELKKEGLRYTVPALGIMIETPAAAVCAEKLAGKVDFFSIGTNDLTQYTLALDRESQGLDRYFQPHHEAVFSLIETTAAGGHRKGIETGVCGQLAADPEAVKRLIRSGVDELSVTVRKVRATRKLAAAAERELLAEKRNENEVTAPRISAVADGELIPMADIPDPAFSSGCLGECFGILPSNGNVYSPVSGTVTGIAETGHAVTIRSDDGTAILVHVGINTVTLGNKAFTHHVSSGDRVENDQLILEADLAMIRNAGLSPMIVVITLNE